MQKREIKGTMGSLKSEVRASIWPDSHIVSVSTGSIRLGPPVDISTATICEFWPVWLDVLPCLDSKGPNYVWCDDPNVVRSCYSEFCENYVLVDDWRTLISRRPDLLLLTGSPKFVSDVSSAFGDVPTWATTGARRGRRLEGLARTRLEWRWTSHAYVGGVTGGAYWVGTNALLSKGWTIREDQNRRCLRDVLSPTEDGKAVMAPGIKFRERPLGKPEVGDNDLSYGNQLLPIGTRGQVIAPSVYSCTGWVRRAITAKEMAAAFDLPVRLQVSETSAKFVDLYRKSVPSKVLNSILEPLRETVFKYERRLLLHLRPPLPLPVKERGYGFEGKAAKADDASADLNQWLLEFRRQIGQRLLSISDERLEVWLGRLRETVVRWWRLRLAKEIRSYMRMTHGDRWFRDEGTTEMQKDKKVLRDVLRKVQSADYWEWHSGSTLFFWRWPPDYRSQARDGVKIFVRSKLPSYRRHQPKPSDPFKAKQVELKLQKVVERGYMEKGLVRSLTGFFDVPKTETDIRLVYDATRCGLNESVWAPNFFIPSADTLARCLTEGSWLGDIDLGEFFLNFPLDPKVRPYAGVDLTHYSGQNRDLRWLRWSRCLMGFKPSPYNSAQTFSWAEEIIRGDPSDNGNPFGWAKLETNLPGDKNYRAGDPWIQRLRSNGDMSGELVAYVDDLRIVGASLDHCWECLKRVSCYTTFLGMQDAVRKRRPPSQSPGPWAGVVAGTDGRPYVTITQERWDKTKRILEELYATSLETNSFDYKQLLSYRGFLIYISRTYAMFKPYLKGLHLTIDSWRPGRGEDGWRLECWKPEEDPIVAEDAPQQVKGVPRLRWDLAALLTMVEASEPAVRFLRPTNVHEVVYGFGDASGKGFGATLTGPNEIRHRVGIWGTDPETASSNYRELSNLVEAIEDGVSRGQLKEAEIFLFTDNSTAENAFFKGSSSNRRLFELVLRLRLLELYHDLHVHLVHCAGTRMIAQGTDALSRGSLLEGVMTGISMLNYVPLNLSCVDRSPLCLTWVSEWFGPAEHLKTHQWYERAHDISGWKQMGRMRWFPKIKRGRFVWTPPPALADVSLEELRRARLKRQESYHVWMCPRLMTPRFRRAMYKVMDFVTEVPAGSIEGWPKTCHEPLIIGLTFPFLSHSPWQLKGTERMVALERDLRQLWKRDPELGRSFLSKLFAFVRGLQALPPGMVWKVLRSERSDFILRP